MATTPITEVGAEVAGVTEAEEGAGMTITEAGGEAGAGAKAEARTLQKTPRGGIFSKPAVAPHSMHVLKCNPPSPLYHML